ncbi:hypothetical protein B0H14DRAFT_2843682 [Mycena olivaceomarginata]|nr:hypothetical protein B0H14DRAFT_2843682 [Mycena olivaceomarginata]
MSPGPFLWLIVGAGIGSWWTAHKRFDRDSHFRRSHPKMIANPSEKTPFNSSDPGNYQAPYNGWDHERARVREFSRTAEDTVTQLSEATLDTILQATEALKEKMAEHRAMREEERRVEGGNTSPRLV